MKKFILVVVLFLGIALVVISLGEIKIMVKTLQQAHLGYLLLAFFIQTLWFLTTARMYKSIFRLLKMNESLFELTKIATAVNFVNIVTATRGMGGVALFASEAKKRGHPTGKATIAAALFLALDNFAFIAILAVGLAVLMQRHDLGVSDIVASILMFLLAAAYAFVLYLGYRSEKKLGALLAKIAHFTNRVAKFFRYKGEALPEANAYEFAHEITEGFTHLKGNPISMVRPIAWGILDKVLLMLILVCSFWAFEVPFTAGVIVAGFSIAFLFLTVSPTPYGIGFVEGFMPLALNSLGVDWSQAVVVTLAYRTVTFWYPLAVGAWALRSLDAEENAA
jgi:hypothetical protein